jgi:hypothetical protein
VKWLCCGDRAWKDYEYILERLRYHGIGPGDVVVHGDQWNNRLKRGADRMCGRAAEALGATQVPVPAEWARYGKRAGHMRNQRMLDEHPDIAQALVFHPDLKVSKGSKDMVARLKRKRIPYFVYPAQPGQQRLF